MLESFVLGIIQGITEWLPVSSEGVVASAAMLFWDASPKEAIALSLWLHLGTSLAALISFRLKIADILSRIRQSPTNLKGEVGFLIVATLVSVLIGAPLLVLGNNILEVESTEVGLKTFSAVIGILMTGTGVLLLARKKRHEEEQHDLGIIDSIITGTAQGIAAIPGLSRSGLTVSALLARGVDRKDALTLSFIMGIPVTAGAGIYSSMSTEFHWSMQNFTALGASFITGLITIKILLKVADRVNFGLFVIGVGSLLVINALLLGPS
jgi:undecaprenyl-diphosphatase